MKINAIIVNGRHGGTAFWCDYSPIIKLPIMGEDQLSIGEKDDLSVIVGYNVEYQECFRSVDGKCVLYSTNGKYNDINRSSFKPTYPINIF